MLTVIGGSWNRPRFSRWSGSLTLLAILVISIFPLGELLLRPLEAPFTPRDGPNQVDGIVVLGGFEDPRSTEFWGQPQVNQAAERLTTAAALALQHPEARLIESGGSGHLRDAVAGRLDLPNIAVDIFTSLGISPARISWEDRSRWSCPRFTGHSGGCVLSCNELAGRAHLQP
ncbi:YdcF family protein [Paracoccus tibetensis]|uniref:YdcF family protein n=1 Tax=Paracoccus tibetensis TaxID=336292 RepID=UPI0011133C87|nr:YdcF family protein [Paracoccus tibetensis]